MFYIYFYAKHEFLQEMYKILVKYQNKILKRSGKEFEN